MQSFKVMCISKPKTWPSLSPNVGDSDMVVYMEAIYGYTFFELARFPDKCFGSDCFATLPDADADQMQEEVREGIANLEHN